MIDLNFRTLHKENGRLYFTDQTRLPGLLVEEEQLTIEQVRDSIKTLKVRGAPAIGVAGAYGLVLSMEDFKNVKPEKFIDTLKKNADYLDSARPTAVNLSRGLNLLVNKAQDGFRRGMDSSDIFNSIDEEANRIHKEDIAFCDGLGEQGMPLIKEGMGILTHCNAGALATTGIGTATAPLYKAHSRGVSFRVYADETRPLLQGARLTSWELMQQGIDATLICDNMAAAMMNKGLIDLIIVGTDRVAANGDVANKIGTLNVAILASYFGIPFYVACPSSTVDLNSENGTAIPIEQRDGEEVRRFDNCVTGPRGIKVQNPAFDVTPAELVSGIITEKGILSKPYEEKLAGL